MANTNKLYKVVLKGVNYSFSTSGAIYGEAYVVAMNAEEAYQKVLDHLQKNDIGCHRDRLLDTITLMADENIHAAGKKLYL